MLQALDDEETLIGLQTNNLVQGYLLLAYQKKADEVVKTLPASSVI
uniref:Ring finger protein n=1 Tax=Rhizophora mucronata TaxID=61149 RepID=A0A2P2Q9A7_RHIMU